MSLKNPNLGEMRRFWEGQARKLGDFRRASSTAYYREGEIRLIESWFNGTSPKKVLKLDLWNEVKNTNILAWMAAQGADTHAMDISFSLAKQAAEEFENSGLVPRFLVGSLYDLPYKPECFDFLYTMGTIEHAPDMDRCVAEIFRVLKPGGIAVVGVPNKNDPFLRPALVGLMNKLGIYPYGLEQSLSKKELRAMLSRGGFEILHSDGVLFMPGVLRMAELALLERFPVLSGMLGALHWPFRALAKVFPGLNRHGYLVACVVRRPGK
jgi:SAM-dependent methyltransferase